MSYARRITARDANASRYAPATLKRHAPPATLSVTLLLATLKRHATPPATLKRHAAQRSATMGSSLVARRAGQKHAAIDTRTIISVIDTMVTGSVGVVRTSTLWRSRPTP